MYDGSDWISDFIQRDMFGGSTYWNDPDYSTQKKYIILSLLLILCFNTACRGDCIEQIKTFYTIYLENVLHDNSRNEELSCKSYLTEEFLKKVDRLINATNVDPLIRAQDASLDAIETLKIEPLTWFAIIGTKKTAQR